MFCYTQIGLQSYLYPPEVPNMLPEWSPGVMSDVLVDMVMLTRCTVYTSSCTQCTRPRGLGHGIPFPQREPVGGDVAQPPRADNESILDPAMPTPLPSNPFSSDLSGQPYVAYQKCIALESRAPTLPKSSPPGVVVARLLGYLLVHSENGRQTLARDIADASDDAALIDLGRLYVNHFVKVCTYSAISLDAMLTVLPVKSASGPTPAPSEHPSRPALEDERNAVASMNDEASLDHRKAKRAVRPSLFL
jgi:hypothetical protein